MPVKSPSRTSRALFAERILLILVVLGLSCLVAGSVIFMAGKIFNALTLGQIGAWMLLIGVALVGFRVFYWVLEGIVGRGADELSKQADKE